MSFKNFYLDVVTKIRKLLLVHIHIIFLKIVWPLNFPPIIQPGFKRKGLVVSKLHLSTEVTKTLKIQNRQGTVVHTSNPSTGITGWSQGDRL